LSAARASEDHAVREVLRVGGFDEDDLYAALESLEEHQSRIETALASQRPGRGAQSVFLYDVTSVYFEGQHNELAQFGYNRDGKRGKKQMVAGLLTDGQGEPLSIQLYPGNTNDPPTFLDAVDKLKVRFGTQEIALVGDRGMIKALGKAALGAAKFRYVTALTEPQVRALLKAGKLQMELFEDQPAEVEANGKRYVLRCNPQTQARERARRADQGQRVKARLEARNAQVDQKPRCEPEASLRAAQALVQKYRLGGWVSVRLEGRKVIWTEDTAARETEAQLDGCYVVESDLPVAVAGTQQVHDRYVDLTRVERGFRTLKTGLLEIRPVFLRKADRTRGQALVSLLALKLARELDRRVAPLRLTVADAVERLQGVRLVCLGEPGLGLWRLADSYPLAQTQVLEALPKLPAPVLSLGKANVRRLKNPRQGPRAMSYVARESPEKLPHDGGTSVRPRDGPADFSLRRAALSLESARGRTAEHRLFRSRDAEVRRRSGGVELHQPDADERGRHVQHNPRRVPDLRRETGERPDRRVAAGGPRGGLQRPAF